jgi:hypothetical protein
MLDIVFSSSDDANDSAGESLDPFLDTRPDIDPSLPADPVPSDSVFFISSDSDVSAPSPLGDPPELTFRFNIPTVLTVRGLRFHFQLALHGTPLYHSKLKRRTPRVPVGISSGFSAHFSQRSFAGFLYPKDKTGKILLTNGSADRVPLLAIEFRAAKGGHPKDIACTLLPQNLAFVSRKAIRHQNGHWNLSFGGKIAVPSVKNCVLVDATRPERVALRMRRVSETDCELDSFGVFDPLHVFGYALASFVNRI